MLNKQYCYPKVEKVARKWRRELIDKATSSERLTLSYLKKLDYRIEFQKIVFISPGKFFIVDIFLPDYKIVVEVDGKHHYHAPHRMKDDIRTFKLKKSGVVDVIRFPNTICKRGEFFKQFLNQSIINSIKKNYGYKKF